MRKCRTLVLLAAGLLLLAGCGGKKTALTETTIDVRKNGTIVHTIVEEFTEEYYDLDVLKQEMADACEAYNASAGKQAVVVESAEVTDGILTVVMQYKNADAYAGFNNLAMFVGTVRDAYNAGYDLDVTLLPADNGDVTIGKSELLEMGSKHLLILRESEGADVKVWDDVLYYTMNVIGMSDPRKVAVTKQEGLTYLIFQ